MISKRILIVGCGKIGLRVANLLSSNHKVWGLRRSQPQNENGDIQFIAADVCNPNSLSKLPKDLDYVIYCLTPEERSETAYRHVYLTGLQNILSALPDKQILKRLYFISSTSVYHQNDNQYVDESSPTSPVNFSGQILLAAEAICSASKHPSTVIRFSGIYGAQRSHLIHQVESGQAKLSKESRLTNRIHEDDCVGFIHYLIQEDIRGNTNEPLFLASDCEPIDLNQVITFLASNLDIKLESKNSGKPDTRRAGNKKCSNTKMLNSGYQLHYPSYREGYLAMLAKQS